MLLADYYVIERHGLFTNSNGLKINSALAIMIVAITPALTSFKVAQIACDAAKGLCEEWIKHYHPAKRMGYNAKIQLVPYLSVSQLHEKI